jgi:hypothetical protein
MSRSIQSASAFLAIVAVTAGGAYAQTSNDLKPQPSPQAVVDEHLAALNDCDVDRIMAQYPENAELSGPDSGGGVAMRGRAAIREGFAMLCKDPANGGLRGLHFGVMKTNRIGDSVIVQWVVTAPFLAKPAMGADAFITKDGLIQGMVTTLNPPVDFKMKE